MYTQTIFLAGAQGPTRPHLSALLTGKGYQVVKPANSAELLSGLQAHNPHVVLVEAVGSRPWEGLCLARSIRDANYTTPVIIVAEDSSEELAIAALKFGATEYFTLPVDSDALVDRIERCCRAPSGASAADKKSTRSAVNAASRLIGRSEAMCALTANIAKIALAGSNVLITGETGTGKELVAELIHEMSPRGDKVLVCINCAAIPETLLESELFGFEKGTFTGAHTSRKGKLQQAHGGTLFLDEIGDMSPFSQSKVLRVLEGKTVQRLGGDRSFAVDIRLVAATNQDLERLVAERQFREDLFFRLNVARLRLPPLRERKEDIPLLCRHFVAEFNQSFGLAVSGFESEALRNLAAYRWPGNVRELRNVVEAAFINRPEGRIGLRDLPEHLWRVCEGAAEDGPEAQIERSKLLSALVAADWNKSEAAKRLKCSRMTLYRRMRKYCI